MPRLGADSIDIDGSEDADNKQVHQRARNIIYDVARHATTVVVTPSHISLSPSIAELLWHLDGYEQDDIRFITEHWGVAEEYVVLAAKEAGVPVTELG